MKKIRCLLKFGFAKFLFVVCFGILFGFGFSNAYFINNPKTICRSGNFPDCTNFGSMNFSPTLISSNYQDKNYMYYVIRNNYFRRYVASTDGFASSFVNSGYLYSYNDGDFLSYSVDGHNKQQYNFINIYSYGELFEFAWWSDWEKKYNTINPSGIPDIPGDDLYYYFVPRHGNFVLYNKFYQTGFDTLQYIGNQALHNKIIYVDPLDQSDNVWLIDLKNMKAWSQYVDDPDLLQLYMFGSLSFSDSDLESDTWDKYYSVSLLTGGNSFYPITAGNTICGSQYYRNGSNSDGGCKSSNYFNVGLSYNRDYNFVGPDFSESDKTSGQYVNSDITSWENYQACERDYSYRNFIVSSRKSCASDYQNGLISGDSYHRIMQYVFEYANIWNGNTTGDMAEFFSGYDYSNANGCQGLIVNAQTLVKLYNILGDPYDYGYYYDVVNELKYISQDRPYEIEVQCGSRPDVPTEYLPTNNSSKVCGLDSWANILNCFSFGSSSSGTGESDSSYFELAIDNMKGMIVTPFQDKFVDPIISEYNSGLALVTQGVNCNASNNLIAIPYIDYVVYSIAILIFFLLFAMI